MKMMQYKFDCVVGKEIGSQEHYEDAVAVGKARTMLRGKEYFADYFAIADGVGSTRFGALAAQTAAGSIQKQILTEMNKIKTWPVLVSSLERFMHTANRKVMHTIKNIGGSGSTTLDAGIFFKNNLYLAHVGDNRAYILRKTGELELITKDENFAWLDKTEGMLVPREETKIHPTSKNLLNMLGRYDDLLLEQIIVYPLENVQAILIATDGLYKSHTDAEICEKLGAIKNNSPREIMEKTLSELTDNSMISIKMVQAYAQLNGIDEETAAAVLKKDNRTGIIYKKSFPEGQNENIN